MSFQKIQIKEYLISQFYLCVQIDKTGFSFLSTEVGMIVIFSPDLGSKSNGEMWK